MTITNGYCNLADLKARYFTGTPTTDAARDVLIENAIEAASRQIDAWTGQQFYPMMATKVFTARDDDRLRIVPLLSVTTLKTDEDGDRTYETTWDTTDYDLLPYNAPPYQWIEIAPNGLHVFPLVRKGVQIVGTWGSMVTSTTSTATLAEDLDTSETGVDVSSGPAFVIGQIIRIGSEDMVIDGIATNTLTVRRGMNGSTVATHTSGAAITILTPPEAVTEACLLLAARLWKRKDAILGVSGVSQLGQLTVKVPIDEDIIALLATYKRVSL